MNKLIGMREKRTILVPGVPAKAQVSESGHIQAMFTLADGSEGYISFSAGLEAVDTLLAEKIIEKIAETTGGLPSYREGSENGTYRAIQPVVTGQMIQFTIGDGLQNRVTLPVTLLIDATVVLQAIPAYVTPEGSGFSDEDLDDDADEDGDEDDDIEDDASL